MTEIHKCAACQQKERRFEITSVRPIYWGYVLERVCPEGHRVTEHRNKGERYGS